MGVFVQIEIILGQPIDDRIIPILFIYRINRNLLELSFQQEDLFQTFQPRLHQIHEKMNENDLLQLNQDISHYYELPAKD
ncbi:unnamed protein product [Rotaria sordida]|uniref:Uncharacterized protein n=2 Tax=Rotaria sordida TaxID=392033 RepID=A0A814G168_9BILA|nr:unnamed protein product [Rotaria sordida]